MQTIERHGGESHYVRPDRIMRTGVLAPTSNFAPGPDVQAVAAAFTERSMNLSGALGDASPLSFLEKLKLRIQAFFAQKKVEAAIQAGVDATGYTPGVVGEQIFNSTPYGMAYAQMGMQVAPSMMGQVQMLAYLTSGNGQMPPAVAQSQIDTTMQHWNNLRWRG